MVFIFFYDIFAASHNRPSFEVTKGFKIESKCWNTWMTIGRSSFMMPFHQNTVISTAGALLPSFSNIYFFVKDGIQIKEMLHAYIKCPLYDLKNNKIIK